MTDTIDRPNYVHLAPKITLADVEFTHHSIERANERGFTPEEIRDTIETPERAWYSRRHQAWTFNRDRLLVALREHWAQPGRWAVITLTWGDEREREDAHVFEEQYEQARRALGWGNPRHGGGTMSFDKWVMKVAGGKSGGSDCPPESRTLYYSEGREVPRGTEDARVIASNNDGFELWFGTPHKWHHHMRAEDVRLLTKYLIWDWYITARWLGLRRPIYYWALHRHVDRFRRLHSVGGTDR